MGSEAGVATAVRQRPGRLLTYRLFAFGYASAENALERQQHFRKPLEAREAGVATAVRQRLGRLLTYRLFAFGYASAENALERQQHFHIPLEASEAGVATMCGAADLRRKFGGRQ